MSAQRKHGTETWRATVHDVIFGHDTPAGKTFDLLLIIAILMSVTVVMLDSVDTIAQMHRPELRAAEWVFTLLFTVEYVLRLWTATSARRYARSFYGIVDLLAVLPTYLALVLPGGQFLITIRIVRILRVFRVLKLARFVGGQRIIVDALRASSHKIAVFMFAVATIVVIVGSVMFLVEGTVAGFDNIPKSVYWAIVTLTTVGYGDIVPQTAFGQIIASFVMVIGYGIIAVPTGIVTAELTAARTTAREAVSCPRCKRSGHDSDATFCKRCGADLEEL